MHPDRHDGRGVRTLARYALSAVGVLVATWLELLIARTPAARLSFFPFGIAIALGVWLGGFGPGLFALFLSTLAIDFFLVNPGGFLDFQTPPDALVFVAFGGGWLAFCTGAGRISRRTVNERIRCAEAERAAEQADRIAQLTAALSQARTPAAAIEAAVQEPLHALEADAGLLVLLTDDGDTMMRARLVGDRAEEQELRTEAALAGKTPATDAIGRGAP